MCIRKYRPKFQGFSLLVYKYVVCLSIPTLPLKSHLFEKVDKM